MPVYPSGGTIAQSVGSPGFGPAPTPSYNASASVRLNPADTANISFNPTIEGSRTTWTLAFWAKRSLLATRQFLVSNYNSATTIGFVMEFDASDRLDIYDFTSPTYSPRLITTQVFRDVGAWYHFTVVLDTSQATNTDRFKLFVNGVQVTAFSTATYPAQFYQGNWNRVGYQSTFGKAGVYTSGTLYLYGGYFADMNFVDGLALTPSSFTSTDANTGQLVPIQHTGSFGINGCYLPFSGAALAVDLGQNPKTTAQDYPYWPYSTLLVNTTSTNGAQNNTFLDSSTNNFTITRNGNTTQGNFTPFNYGGGTTQANGYYSGYFDGTGDYLTVPSNAAFDLGSGNATIETWIYPTTSGQTCGIFDKRSVGANYSQFPQVALVSGAFVAYVSYSGSSWAGTINGATPAVNTWTHVAFVRNGNTWTLYVNGVISGTPFTAAGSVYASTDSLVIGASTTGGLNPFSGYISNARILKGTAVYTSNFTVPTTPLTNITNTSLLTCQSSQFIDNSTNAFAITTNGNSQPLPTNPFGMTAWSGYFDGTGDYLTVANNAALDPNTGSFCMECWVYITGTTGNNQGFNGKGTAGTDGYSFFITNALVLSFIWNGTGGTTVTGGTLSLNTWNHVAVVRNSGVIRLYLNGVGAASSTACTTDINSNNGLFIGQARGGNPILGNISNYRMTKGTLPSGYDATTSTLPVPTAPLTAITGTSLLTCQSSTFVDNSTNAFAINVFGNSYTGTLNNPFGNPINYTTPPVQAWSTYFDGSGDYISTTPTALTYGIGMGAFTWESWIYTTNSSATGQGIWHYYTTVVDNFYPYIVSSTGTFNCTLRATNQAVTTVSSPAGVIRLNQWHHVVVTRDSATNISLYVDGKKVANGTIAATTSFADTVMNTTNGNNPTIGAQTNVVREYFYGYISNLRFVKGAVVYTGNFTPPTAPLTAIPGTMTLACQSNRVRDNSILNAAQVANGNTSISPVSPFIPSQAWSAASYGGTMYFDGTGDYLSIADNATLEFGSSDFTIEAFIYPTATVGANRPIWSHGTNSTNWMSLYLHTTAGRPEFAIISGGSTIVDIWPADVISPNIWYHLAVTRSGSTFRMFLNGALIGTGTNASAVPDYTDDYRVGFGRWNGDTGVYAGYISNFRILKGTALYTTPFVPPVLPPTSISNTSLLLNATNSGIYDATGQNVLETVGNAQVSTAVKKWGTSSVYLDGSGDYLVIPTTNAPCQFGTADFTIEAWIYSTTIANQQMILSNRIAATGSANFDLQIVTSKLRFGTTSTDLLIGTITLSSNTWYHVAVSRVSGTARMFVNGVLDTSTTTSFNLSNNSITHIGTNATYAPTQYPFIGYIQDLRITKGVGRYSGNFTPPTAAFAYNRYDICNQQWAPTNISVTAGVGQDNLVDSPSDYGTDTGLGGQVRGNYATLNPLRGTTGTLSNGNLQYTGIVGDATRAATIGVSSGKWYAEFNVNSALGSTVTMGIAVYDQTAAGTSNASQSRGYFYTGQKYSNGSLAAYGNSFTNGDVIGVALDLDAGKVWFSKNGVFQASGDPVAGTNAAYTDLGTTSTWFVSVQSGGSAGTSASAFLNAGQRAFAYAAPSGFKCLVSTNLPTPTIGTTSSTRADDYFNVNTWTGNGSQVPVGFNPELLWYKARNAVGFGGVVDVLRGDTKYLQTYSTNAEGTQAGLLTTNSTGFVPGAPFSTNNYVAWSWKANGAGVTNTDGSITSTISANATSGCSVVRYTGTGANATVGHGLGKQLKFLVVKELSNVDSWVVWHTAIPGTQYLVLNTEAAAATAAGVWNSTVPSSSAPYVFSVGTNTAVNQSGQPYVAYCFTDIPSFSSMGTFTGNNASDGPFVYTGFRPAYVLIKSTNFGSSGSTWVIKDELRAANYNPATGNLYANLDYAEDTTATVNVDLLSNGFKLRGSYVGINGPYTYMYVAFAEFPFKYSRAR